MMKTLLDLALSVGDSAIAQRVIGKQRYAAHVVESVRLNAQIFKITDRAQLKRDYIRNRAHGQPAWMAIGNARAYQPISR